jgi:hypothetical protein
METGFQRGHLPTLPRTPDPGAEVSVGGLDFLSIIGLSESDLSSSSFELVMAEKSAPFF